MLLSTGLLALLLGIVVWFFGNRLWLLGAAAGALLGIGLVTRFPGLAGGWAGFVLVAGLTIGLSVLGFLGRRFAKMIALIIGFIAGGGIALGFLDALGLSLGFWGWILAVIVGLAVGLAFRRWSDWGFIILAGLVGSLLIVRGLTAFLPSLVGPLGTVIVIALTALGVYYNYRRQAPKSAPSAASSG
jgi:hypothetical protein